MIKILHNVYCKNDQDLLKMNDQDLLKMNDENLLKMMKIIAR
jgi:hypothetical protein